MKLYFIRHGKTAGNLEGRYVGRTDEPLCPQGIGELTAEKERLFLPGVSRVFVSPMLRCRQTAKILFPDLPGEPVADLRECDFGAFEYKTWRELSGDARYQAWIDSGGSLPFPEGESPDSFRQRCRLAFAEILADFGKDALSADGMEDPAGNAAFVVHGGTIMSILSAYAVPQKSYFDYQAKNGCGYAAEWDRNAKEIQLLDIRALG